MILITAILLAVHLLAFNVASAGPLLCIWLHGRGKRDAAAWQVGQNLARLSLASFFAGVISGAALLAFAWLGADRPYWAAVARLPTRELAFAMAELAFSGLLMWLYVSMWDRWQARPWLAGLVAFVAATNLLYHFPPLLIALGELADRPSLAAEPLLARSALRPMMLRPEVLAQVAHFVIASFSVAGVAVMVAARWRDRRDESSELAVARLVALGASIALAATLIQLGVGPWVLLELPDQARRGLMGGDITATCLFVASLLAILGLLHVLAGAALGDTSGRAVRRAALIMLLTVTLMTAAQLRGRQLLHDLGGKDYFGRLGAAPAGWSE
jgi:hypothetical protein